MDHHNFRVGQTVKVKSSTVCQDWMHWIGEMNSFCGKLYKIRFIRDDGYLQLQTLEGEPSDVDSFIFGSMCLEEIPVLSPSELCKRNKEILETFIKETYDEV